MTSASGQGGVPAAGIECLPSTRVGWEKGDRCEGPESTGPQAPSDVVIS